MSTITTSDDTLTRSTDEDSGLHSTESEEEEDNVNNGQDNKTVAICYCGRELDTGWQCPHCRRECPICHRALSLDPEDYCEKCFRFCKYHGLYSIIAGSVKCHFCNKN